MTPPVLDPQSCEARYLRLESRHQLLARKAKIYKRQLRESQAALHQAREAFESAASYQLTRRRVLEDRIELLTYQLQAIPEFRFRARVGYFIFGLVLGNLLTLPLVR